ncbi:hypothetical protein A7U60_g2007 [Sanghuangporus baumii]|uniref:Expansin-like protein n=1 Tax=Sanghuangporus baumii TaxID=108892 RepID=A0A9Q5I315_SANBA|nr:hypothetical protein A7U60_g2007 [Sanghuangporus baumii]
MRLQSISSLSILSAIVSLAVSAAPFEFNVAARNADLGKRTFSNARLTWYDPSVGITACGGTFSNNDHVVALNSQQFGSGFPGPNCGKNIRITVGGKSATAQVVDNCPGCPFAGLDLTEGLFSVFADLSVGVLTGSWDFI